MASFLQISGRYYARFKKSGKTASVPLGESERKAKIKLRQLEADYDSGTWSPFDKDDESLPDLQAGFDRFIRDKIRQGVKLRPLSLYRTAVQSFLRHSAITHFSEFTPGHIQDWVNSLTVSASTRKTYLTHLKVFIRHSVVAGWLKKDPTFKLKTIRTEKPIPDHLERSEFESFISHLNGSVRHDAKGDTAYIVDLIELAPLTMMRLSEMVNLKWTDIRDGMIYVRNTKGKKSRTVPATGRILDLLNRIKSRGIDSEFVFSFDGSKLSPYNISRRFRHHARQAGIRESIHFHSLRHSGATWFLRSTGDLMTLKEILGHSDISVTQIYTHITGTDKINQMGSFLASLNESGIKTGINAKTEEKLSG